MLYIEIYIQVYMFSRHWTKVIFILVAVMGIAWIANVLFFDVNLLFIAYIMTIFIAGQGIIIFIVLVPLSKQVKSIHTDIYTICMPIIEVQWTEDVHV